MPIEPAPPQLRPNATQQDLVAGQPALDVQGGRPGRAVPFYVRLEPGALCATREPRPTASGRHNAKERSMAPARCLPR